MKKVFPLQQENKHPDRVIEAIKNEIRKYLKRERKKKLPEDAIFWDFDCRFGQTRDDARSVKSSEVITSLDKAKEANWEACYVEITARASFKEKVMSNEG